MFTFLLVVQILVSVSIISLVLLQHGKGADMGAAFGSGSSGTVFGARGSGSFLTRTTAVLAVIFFVNCLLIASPLVRETGSGGAGVADRLEQQVQQQRQAEEAAVAQDVPEVQVEEEAVTVNEAPAEAATAAEPALPPDVPEVAEDAGAPAGDTPGGADDLPR